MYISTTENTYMYTVNYFTTYAIQVPNFQYLYFIFGLFSRLPPLISNRYGLTLCSYLRCWFHLPILPFRLTASLRSCTQTSSLISHLETLTSEFKAREDTPDYRC